jgi:MinD-like ATPase involved in chromosome partitioning or flagellar assembly
VTLVAVASAKASPGVTTLSLAMALAWPRRDAEQVRLVELDVDGGVIAARLGLRAEPNLASLAVAGRRSLDESIVRDHEQLVATGVSLIAAPAAGEQVVAAVASLGPALGAAMSDGGTDVIVDAGRLSPRSPVIEIARQAALTLLVATPRRDEVEAVSARGLALQDAGCAVGLVCNQVRNATEAVEFAGVAGLDLTGVIGADPRTAAALCGDGPLGDRMLARSALLRHAADVSCAVIERIRPRSTALASSPVGGEV